MRSTCHTDTSLRSSAAFPQGAMCCCGVVLIQCVRVCAPVRVCVRLCARVCVCVCVKGSGWRGGATYHLSCIVLSIPWKIDDNVKRCTAHVLYTLQLSKCSKLHVTHFLTVPSFVRGVVFSLLSCCILCTAARCGLVPRLESLHDCARLIYCFFLCVWRNILEQSNRNIGTRPALVGASFWGTSWDKRGLCRCVGLTRHGEPCFGYTAYVRNSVAEEPAGECTTNEQRFFHVPL